MTAPVTAPVTAPATAAPTRASAPAVATTERSRRLALAVVAAAALSGAALGVAGDRVVLARRPAPAAHGLDAFAAEMQLTDAQRAAVDSLMDERRRTMDAIVAPVRPQLDAVREAGRREIRRRLTPDQQARFDAYVARLDREQRPRDRAR